MDKRVNVFARFAWRSCCSQVLRPGTDAGGQLACLSPPHRAALTLRYLDDLPVPEVADFLERTVHATEALLVRARSAFRRAYEAGEDLDG